MRKRKLNIIWIWLPLFLCLHLKSQSWEGHTNFNSDDKSFSNGSCIINDEIYSIVNFKSSLDYSNINLSSTSNQDGCIIQMDSSWNVIHFIPIQSSNQVELKRILEVDNELFICGTFRDSLFIKEDTVKSFGNKDVFFLHLDDMMNVLQFFQIKGLGAEQVGDFEIQNNLLHFIGTTSSPTVFSDFGFQESNHGGVNAFYYQLDLLTMDEQGLVLGGIGDDEGKGIAIFENNIHLLISFSDTLVTNDTMVSLAEHDLCVLQLNEELAFNWSINLGSDQDDHGERLCTDNYGNVYFTGDFRSTIIKDNHGLTSYGGYDVIIGKISKNGNLEWLDQIGWIGDDHGLDISYDKHQIFVSGYFSGSAMFNENITSTFSIRNGFVCSYKRNGTYNYHLYSYGNNNARMKVNDHYIHQNKSIINGYFSGEVILSNTLQSLNEDAFIGVFEPKEYAYLDFSQSIQTVENEIYLGLESLKQEFQDWNNVFIYDLEGRLLFQGNLLKFAYSPFKTYLIFSPKTNRRIFFTNTI